MERPAWFDPDLFPFESRWIEAEGCSVHYIDHGTGPTLLMLHGNPTWSFLYRRLITGLSDRFRCVALDFPGFGLSRAGHGYGFTAAEHARVLGSVVDQLELDHFIPVVQDWGGPIGLEMATRRPDRVDGLIVGNTWAWPVTGNKTAARFSALMGGERSGRILVDRLNIFVNVFVARGIRRRKPSIGELAMYRGPFPTAESRRPIRVFAEQLVGATGFLEELELRLPALTGKPALVLWADHDPAFRRSDLQRWQRTLTNHHLHMLRGAGHYWQDDAGEEAVLAIRDWLPA